MADVAHEENVIEHEERAFIHSIIDFGDTVAREVMVPRPDMVTIERRPVGDRGARDGTGRRVQPHPGPRRADRRRGGHRLHQGPHAGRTGGQGRGARAGERPPGGVRPRVQGGLLACCARCRRRSSTWRSWSTSTAARPGWSPSRTCSKSWSARSSTSSTWRSRASSSTPTARSSSAPATPSTTPTTCWAPSSPRGPGTRWAASCSTWSAGCRRRRLGGGRRVPPHRAGGAGPAHREGADRADPRAGTASADDEDG